MTKAARLRLPVGRMAANAIGAVAFVAAIGFNSDAGAVELKYGTFLPAVNPVAKIMQQGGKELALMTEGRVTIKVYTSGALAKSTDQLDAVQKGVMDIGSYIWTYSSFKQRPFFMVGSLPFLYRDAAGYLRAWNADPTLLKMANVHLQKYGYDNVILMEAGYAGFSRIGLRNKKARVPADLKRLKIRGTGTYINVIRSYGAAGVTIDNAQVYGSLERGLIDGTLGLDVNWVFFKWSEPVTYMVNYNLAPVGETMAVNKAAFNKLSKRDQALFRIFIKKQVVQITNLYLQLGVSTDSMLRKKKIEVYTPTDAEKKLWAAPSGQIVNQWLNVVGKKDGEKALAIIRKYNR